MSPKNAIDQLRAKLNFVGFDFETKDVPTSGSVSFPLNKATEIFGKSPTTPFDEFEKGGEGTGLTLTVRIEQDENSLYNLTGKIS